MVNSKGFGDKNGSKFHVPGSKLKAGASSCRKTQSRTQNPKPKTRNSDRGRSGLPAFPHSRVPAHAKRVQSLFSRSGLPAFQPSRLPAAGSSPLIVAIDGPSGVGKSTVAKRLGVRLGLPYLDTGKMYRAFGLHCRRMGADLNNAAVVKSLLNGFKLPDLADPALLTEAAGEAASLVSQIPEVRARMVALQRAEGLRTGCVVEGRDATTKIFPDAAHKFFLFADERVRIRRRWRQVGGDWAAIARQVVERDRRDRSRKASPLTLASDAIPMDTTAMGVSDVVDLMAWLVRAGSVQ